MASPDRVGRYARGLVWAHVLKFIQRLWKILLLPLLLPIVVTLAFFPLMHGWARWMFIGAMGISGPWFVVIVVILYSGAATPLMGLDGENSTADVLRRLRREGWMLVNGIKIKRQADIDHVLIGPGGVIVVESKWSHYKWPIGDKHQTFMSGTLSGAVAQVHRNRHDVELKFAKVLNGIPVRAVCALWSTEDSSKELQWIEHGDVFVVRGPYLNTWVRNLTGSALDEQTIELVWKEIENYALQYDVNEFELSGVPRPTIVAFIKRSVLAPFAAFMLALYGLVALSHVGLVWVTGGIILFIGVGFRARKIPILHRAALGWIVSSVGFVLLLLGVIIRNVIG
jgi:hypothetical protein